MSDILMTVGPIPSKLDSVKYLGNRFKGGLSLKTAIKLREYAHNVTIIAWKYADIVKDIEVEITKLYVNKPKFNLILIDDVMDYYEKVLEKEYDTYILSAAVANLMPTSPFEGKFPSHKYNVGERFNIEFTISPRVIDQIRVKYPKAKVVGYKLYDGTTKELLQAGKKIFKEAKASVVFANTPEEAKYIKWAITPTGSFIVSFTEHVEIINNLADSNYTKSVKDEKLGVYSNDKLTDLLKGEEHGAVSLRGGSSCYVSARKDKSSLVSVSFKDDMTIFYGQMKPSAMGLFFNQIYKNCDKIKFCLHRHDFSSGYEYAGEYMFPFTDLFNEYARFATRKLKDAEIFIIDLPAHGYVICSHKLTPLEYLVKEIKDGRVKNMEELQKAIPFSVS